jgi:hypothetical protein
VVTPSPAAGADEVIGAAAAGLGACELVVPPEPQAASATVSAANAPTAASR